VSNKPKVVQPAAPVETPTFQRPSSSVLENAANGKQAILIFFPGEKDDAANFFGGKDFKALEAKAQFVSVPYNSDREPSPVTEESLVPTSKLLSDNPSREYGIRVYPSFIIADSYGNTILSLSGKKPTAKELEAAFDKVGTKMDDNAKKLQRRLDNAKKSWESKDAIKSMSEIRGNFKDGLVGYDAQNETIRIYHEVIEAARTQVETLKAEGTPEALKSLKALKNTFKDTEVENDINEALKTRK
jgi:hypothetical protein